MSLIGGTRRSSGSADALAQRTPQRAVEAPSGAVLGDLAGADPSEPKPVRDFEGLRALLNADRGAVGERRTPTRIAPIKTSSYTTPLHVLWRRYLRAHRKGLLQGAGTCLVALALIAACWFLARPWLQAKSRAWTSEGSGSAASTALATESFPRAVRREQKRTGIAPDRPAAPLPYHFEREPAEPDGLSVRRRLVRADALLRHPSDRAARQARALLERTLPEVPKDVHGRASLAEACLRLGDEACARAAIAEALSLRPRRSRYRALSREIERAFAQPGASADL